VDAAKDLFTRFDDHSRRIERTVKRQDDEDSKRREHEKGEASTAFERLKDIARGKRPTRETNEDYRKRRASEDLGL
jgi:hypothetical protein